MGLLFYICGLIGHTTLLVAYFAGHWLWRVRFLNRDPEFKLSSFATTNYFIGMFLFGTIAVADNFNQQLEVGWSYMLMIVAALFVLAIAWVLY